MFHNPYLNKSALMSLHMFTLSKYWKHAGVHHSIYTAEHYLLLLLPFPSNLLVFSGVFGPPPLIDTWGEFWLARPPRCHPLAITF